MKNEQIIENVAVWNQARKKNEEQPAVLESEEVQEDTSIELPGRFAPARVTPENYLSSGVTSLNLTTTNHPDCFVEKGTYVLFVGTSGSGKSFLAMQMLAEAANNPNFEDYELVYDDAENGALFDVQEMFGSKLASRLRAPRYDTEGVPNSSATVEDFFFNVDDLQKEKKPFIYVLDSMDSLTSSPSDVKFEENKALRRTDLEKGKDTSVLTQGYGDGKAKLISGFLRRVVNRLKETGSILIIISQVRDNITGYGPKHTRSGGNALRFFAHEEFWVDTVRTLTRTVDKKERSYGQVTKVDIKKNRTTGIKSSTEFQILLGAGISDTDTALEYLCTEGQIERPARSNGLYDISVGKIQLNEELLMSDPWFSSKFSGKEHTKFNRDDLIAVMEIDFEPFKKAMWESWNAVLSAITPVRKRKYE